MNFRGVNDFRDKRNQFLNMPYSPMHYSIASYCSDTPKNEMKANFGEDFLSTLPIIADPLRKNLADTLITTEVQKKVKTKSFLEKNSMGVNISVDHPEIPNDTDRSEAFPFATITNFISGVFNVITGAMFQKRAKSPADQHYDVFDYADERKRSPDYDWQSSKVEDQNIDERAHKQNGENKNVKTMEMNNDYRATVSICEDKLNQVRNLLTKKPTQNISTYRPRRPRKQFVDVGSYEEVYEDAFTAEDFVTLADDPYIEYICPSTYQNSEFIGIDSPKTRIYSAPSVNEGTETADSKPVPEVEKLVERCDKTELKPQNCVTEPISDIKCNIISSCEDKLSKLKALLQEKKNTKIKSNDGLFEIEPTGHIDIKKIQKVEHDPKVHNKHHKNHHRTTNKRQKTNLRRCIQEDMLFANEIEPDGLSSVENSPPIRRDSDHLSETPSSNQTDDFDEIAGRFRNSSTTESDDSFQIVFTEAQKPMRTRKLSECDSEDSFIIFDDSPDSCYLSTDVFGDTQSDVESEYSDTDSEASDSGCAASHMKCKLSPHLSRTISDLTDDSLYEYPTPQNEDQVDCAFTSASELPSQEIKDVVESEKVDVVKKKEPKKVHFSTQPPKVHVMRVWAFAARQARAGHWERFTLDRERFKRRIADVEMAVSWVLKPQHRSRVLFQRFRPWWNAQRRKEIADKKIEDEKKRIEQEEQERIQKEIEEAERREKELAGETSSDNSCNDVGAKPGGSGKITKVELSEEVLNRFLQNLEATAELNKKKKADKLNRRKKNKLLLNKDDVEKVGVDCNTNIIPNGVESIDICPQLENNEDCGNSTDICEKFAALDVVDPVDNTTI